MNPYLTDLTLPELKQLRASMDQIIEEKTQELTKQFLDQMANQAEELGLDVDEVLGKKTEIRRRHRGEPISRATPRTPLSEAFQRYVTRSEKTRSKSLVGAGGSLRIRSSPY